MPPSRLLTIHGSGYYTAVFTLPPRDFSQRRPTERPAWVLRTSNTNSLSTGFLVFFLIPVEASPTLVAGTLVGKGADLLLRWKNSQPLAGRLCSIRLVAIHRWRDSWSSGKGGEVLSRRSAIYNNNSNPKLFIVSYSDPSLPAETEIYRYPVEGTTVMSASETMMTADARDFPPRTPLQLERSFTYPVAFLSFDVSLPVHSTCLACFACPCMLPRLPPPVLHRRVVGHQQRHGAGPTRGAERDLVLVELRRKGAIPRSLLGVVRLLYRREPPLPLRLPPRLLLPRLDQAHCCLYGMEQAL